MPRAMPRLDAELKQEADLAVSLCLAGELAATGTAAIRREWTLTRLEALYELAFLRVFINWEICLESLLCRSMCGYESSQGMETVIPIAGATLRNGYYPTLGDAEAAILGGQPFKLWHDPVKVIARCNQHIEPNSPARPQCIGLQASILGSAITKLTNYGAVRHRIAHGQQDARTKFDAACRVIAGRTYPRSSPGKFLRDKTGNPPRSHLEIIAAELVGLAGQMV